MTSHAKVMAPWSRLPHLMICQEGLKLKAIDGAKQLPTMRSL